MRPKHTHPDNNQLEIERYLQELGFLTYRMCDSSPQRNSVTKTEFHPLDLLVLGLNHHTNRVELTLWEVKTKDNAPFTDQEIAFFSLIADRFGSEVPVNTVYVVDDILLYYGLI